jgi:hypothetical protein
MNGLPDAARRALEELLTQVEAGLDGDVGAVRAAYAVVEREALAYDARTGGTSCREVIEGWGSELAVLGGSPNSRAG